MNLVEVALKIVPGFLVDIMVRTRGRAPIHVVSLFRAFGSGGGEDFFQGLWWTSLSEQIVQQILKLQEHATVIH